MMSFKTYYTNYDRFLNGIMTSEEWEKFADQVFNEILEENKEMFIRFQNEWAE